MDNIYFLMIIALVFLAVADLIVGVSNDAVNFLNSAIGSKAISFRTIMVVASLGIAIGAIFSSGMMEVARKGIFNPNEFMFNEIMIIFMAVMITDILLLDFFNTIGMPTSTTVSIVFELLGASVAMAFLKVGAESGNYLDVFNYINTSKATEIISGILLSVVIAFSVGAIVQYISRILLTFDFRKKAKWIGALFCGIALTAITYFILIKGIKGASFVSDNFLDIIQNNTVAIVIGSLFLWFLISYVISTVLNYDVYKIIIVAGTFALALAFAGNDLVNFIGVPIAAYESFIAWSNSGLAANEFNMGILSKKVATNPTILFGAGMIMVLTLWFSKKARYVAETEINLSREGESKERFQPNFLSRTIVRAAMLISTGANTITPKPLQKKIDAKFEKPVISLSKDKTFEMPAFDIIRAAVNLMVAGVLISIATSYKLPLSTTYVTFMVAMGTSLADRAWGAESAVYRVAGVLNVIGGWFFTAFMAFTSAAVIAYLINIHVPSMFAILLLIAVFLLVRNYISHNKKSKEISAEDSLRKAESSSIQGVIEESANNISNVAKRSNKIYTNTINGLAKQDLDMLKKNKKQVTKLSAEVDDLRDHIFYFIKNLDETSVGASNFYINILGYLQDMAQSLEYLSKISHKHINNNHKKLKYNQIKEIKEIDQKLDLLLSETKEAFETRNFTKIGSILGSKQTLLDMVSQKIEKQIERTRTEESSPKNTTLYFTILLETKDFINATMNLLELYYQEHDSTVQPAKVEA
ncbi:inorganic phosphate transporter [Arenibacter latericius]|uniref:inorganic phosphate transporter n=1 Tax=Arenibacter latericius TaxID=86104 RepID=UPI00047BC323|nr:inorganic phosphate transporter [Arenibacter latericius]MDX1363865.1 inorganic phosphate transporter [Arenibacter latericius]